LVEVLLDVASEDPRLVVLTGDRARECGLQPFADAYGDRFFNLGTADRNLIGTAAGMAAAGKLPVVVTAGASAALTALDLIRDIVARSALHVVIAAMPAGIESRVGGVQHALEDLATMMSIPGLKVVAPADSVQTSQAARILLATPGPSYLRVLAEPLPVILDDESHAFVLGSALTLREGSDMTLIATGALTAEALAAAAALEKEGISAGIINIHTLKPLDAPAIRRAAKETGAVIVCEEHYLHGGLGAAVAQEVGRSHPVPIEFVAVEDRFMSGGSPDALRDSLHLRQAAIVEAARRLRERRR
jgi:transketolase